MCCDARVRQSKRLVRTTASSKGEDLEKSQPQAVSEYTRRFPDFPRQGDWRHVLRLLSKMREEGHASNLINFNTAISAFEKGSNALTLAYEKGWQWKQALDDLTLAGAEPDVISFNAAIFACAKGGQWKQALHLLDEISRVGAKPNLISLNAAVSACENAGQWQRALELLDNMSGTSMLSTSASEEARQATRPRTLLDEMIDVGITPDGISFNATIAACVDGNRWQQALSLLDEMSTVMLTPNSQSFGAAISACGNARQWERALSLLDRMLECEPFPNASIYYAAVSACERGGQWQRALALLDDMRKVCAMPDSVSRDMTMKSGVETGKPTRCISNEASDETIQATADAAKQPDAKLLVMRQKAEAEAAAERQFDAELHALAMRQQAEGDAARQACPPHRSFHAMLNARALQQAEAAASGRARMS